MGFVLVQHLDPRHESILAELLSGKTPMPVLQVEEGMPVKPDHVYVVPSNAEMVIEDKILRLLPRSKGAEQYHPIDSFFAALAADRRHNAIGVVLSGAATDGTAGLKAIKSEGGITFAQDSSAKFDSMPRSAIAAGVVDFVLSPHEIAEKLVGIAGHPYRQTPQLSLADDGSALKRILAVLRTRSGVDFSQYKPSTLLRRLSRRMVVRDLESTDQYLLVLQQEPGESEVALRRSSDQRYRFFSRSGGVVFSQDQSFPTTVAA